MKKTIKIIDLLNKIANGEEMPKNIKYHGDIYEYNQYDNRYHNTQEGKLDLSRIFGNYNFNYLNDEVEIIEEDKKIEKINCDYIVPNTPANENEAYIMSCLLAHELKINEIIDAINELKGKSE